jgi:hypothetical protein
MNKNTIKGFIAGVLTTVAIGTTGVAAASSYFFDVPDGQWYTAAVNWAEEHGVIAGTGANTFSPDQPVTRAQLAQVLYNLSKQGMIGGQNTNSQPVQQQAPQPPQQSTAGLTLANYNKIEKGMTYDQVVAILGSPGKQTSNFNGDYIQTSDYQWTIGDSAEIDIEFDHGKVSFKTQYGLQ